MKKHFFSFFLGFLTSSLIFLTILSMIEIPEYIIEVECRRPMI